ncbi:MAG: S8 family serine peptidase [Eubacterium sp.]|nr:S8 family serine peptidase [Eubacterium sp.]
MALNSSAAFPQSFLSDALSSVSVFASDSFEAQLSALISKYDEALGGAPSRYKTRRVIASSDGELKNTFGAEKMLCDGQGTYVFQFKTEAEARRAHRALSADKRVSEAVPDGAVHAFGDIKIRNGARLINSDRYKEYLKSKSKNERIVVAVLDTGVDTEHDVFFRRCIKGYNAYKNNSNISDSNGHGTHVAGIIADNTPENVKIMPVKVLTGLGAGSDTAIKLGIEYAVKHGADVINLSLGGSCTEKGCPIKKAIRKAVEKGVTVIVAAGNDAADTKYTCPACMSETVTVASTNEYGSKISDFSNFGDSVDLAAPGENIESAYLGKTNAQLSGTSMATPFASAAAALLLTNNPSLKPAGLKTALKGCCADMYNTGRDRLSGAGIINLGIALGDKLAADKITLPLDKSLEMNYFKHAAWYLSGAEALSGETTESAAGDIYSPSITDRSFEAKSSDPSVAVFNGKYIVPKGQGTAVITLKSKNGGSTSVTVKVNALSVWTDSASKKFGGGKGTKKKPYLIKNAAQLAKLSRDVRNGRLYNGKYFKITKNINLKGKLWHSIGCYRYENSFLDTELVCYSFGGVLDGANHRIKNMTVFSDALQQAKGDTFPVNALWYENGGLFGTVANATVKRLGVENARITNSESGIFAQSVGSLSTVNRCFTSGTSEGSGFSYYVGDYGVSIKNCYSSASVKNGGMFNYIYSSDSESAVRISNCFFCGKTAGESGGFADRIESAAEFNAILTNCFSVSKSGGGFIRENIYSPLYRCYYNKSNNKGIKRKRGPQTVQLKAKSAAFFKKKKNYKKAKSWKKSSPWDFKNTWAINKKINGGYPYLKHIKPSGKN